MTVQEEYTDEDLFDYIDGKMERARVSRLESRMRQDEEFNAKIEVFRYVVGLIEGDVVGQQGLTVESSEPTRQSDGTAIRVRSLILDKKLLVPLSLAAVILLAFGLWISIQSNSDALARLADPSGEFVVAHDGSLRTPEWAGNISEERKDELATTLLTGRFRKPSIYSQLSSPEGMKGRQEFPALIFPVETNVRSTQPVFRWKRIEGARHYAVSVFSEDGTLVAKEDSIEEAEWQIEQKLDRGASYRWSFEAVLEGSQVFEYETMPWLRVLSEEEMDRLAKVEGRLDESPIMLALLYVEFGLFDEASKQLEVVARNNPGSELVQELQRSLTKIHRGA